MSRWRERFPATRVIKNAHHLWKIKREDITLEGNEKIVDSIPCISLGETAVVLCCEVLNGGLTLRAKDKDGNVKAQKYFYGEAGNKYIVLVSIANKFSKGDFYTLEIMGTPNANKEMKLWNMVILGVQQGIANWREAKI